MTKEPTITVIGTAKDHASKVDTESTVKTAGVVRGEEDADEMTMRIRRLFLVQRLCM